MSTIIYNGIIFFLGMVVGVQLLGAFFAFIDLAYAFRREAFRIFRPIIGWGGLVALMIWLLGAEYCWCFIYGIGAYCLSSIIFFWSGKLLFLMRYKKRIKRKKRG